jgi:glycosyltransferase involved in cell wall biosynthesis
MSALPRLLLIAPTVAQYLGGTETVVMHLARRLAASAELTVLVGHSEGGPAPMALPFAHRVISVPFAGRDSRANRWQARWLRQNRFRVESRTFFGSLRRQGIALDGHDAVLTFYEHDALLFARRHPRVRALHLLPGVGHRRFFRSVRPDDVVFLGQRGAERAQRKWGLTIPSLPLGVDEAFFGAPRPAPVDRRVVFVGRLDGSKRVDWLADLFAGSDLAERGYSLELIGDGPLGDALAARHGHTPGLHLLGRRGADEVAATLREARLLLHPTELESFGLTILEAMAAGTPVVTHALPSIRAWAGDHPCYAAHLDRSAWLDAIAQFEDPATWVSTSTRNAAFARGFGWDAIAAQVLAKLGVDARAG